MTKCTAKAKHYVLSPQDVALSPLSLEKEGSRECLMLQQNYNDEKHTLQFRFPLKVLISWF